jgi:hypothetical protein
MAYQILHSVVPEGPAYSTNNWVELGAQFLPTQHEINAGALLMKEFPGCHINCILLLGKNFSLIL